MNNDLLDNDADILDEIIEKLQYLRDEATELSEHVPGSHSKVLVIRAALTDLDGVLFNHIDGYRRMAHEL